MSEVFRDIDFVRRDIDFVRVIYSVADIAYCRYMTNFEYVLDC